MLTRRGFSGFAACATCGIGEFVAAEVVGAGHSARRYPRGHAKDFVADARPSTGLCELVEATIEPA